MTGSSEVTSGALSLFAAEGLLPRCNVLESSYLILAGESSPVLAGGLLALSLGTPSCDGVGLLSRCGGGIGVPLKLGQVTWGSFRVVVGLSLELHGAAPL